VIRELVIPMYLAAVLLGFLAWIEIDLAREQLAIAERRPAGQVANARHAERALGLCALTGLVLATTIALDRTVPR
jgi:hypothetical protein